MAPFLFQKDDGSKIAPDQRPFDLTDRPLQVSPELLTCYQSLSSKTPPAGIISGYQNLIIIMGCNEIEIQTWSQSVCNPRTVNTTVLSLLQMDFIKNSPSKFTTCFQDHLQNHVQRISVRMETCDKQRQLDALSLSARKSIKFRTKSSESTKVARTLFQNSLNMKGANIRDLLQDNIKTTLREVINNVASPIANKRKYSNILNDNRRNYEAVDLSVDLCCADEEDDSEQKHKKIRMSV